MVMDGRNTSLKKKEEALEKEQWMAAAWDMLYLVQCGINSIVPDPERIAEMNLEKVYARSKSQSLEVLTYMALESLMKSDPQVAIPDETQVLPSWRAAKNKAVAKNLKMDAEREQLFAFLEEQGIWYVALKGIVLCHLYPKYGMRQMADNDILFDPSFRQEVHDWFVEQGYDVKSFQKVYHDVYLKKPVYNFEMHTALFSESAQLPFEKYYLTINDKLLPVPGKPFEYCMTDEDFYLYVLAHEYKHYSGDGTGLRFLLDLYVYLRAKEDLNWKYLHGELEKMGLVTFEKQMRELAEKVFSPQWNAYTLVKREKILLKSLLFSRAYGARMDFWREHARGQEAGNKVPIEAKVRYLKDRLFLDSVHMEIWCQRYEPYFLRHRWLMPVAPVWRIGRRILEKGKDVKDEVDAVRKL